MRQAHAIPSGSCSRSEAHVTGHSARAVAHGNAADPRAKEVHKSGRDRNRAFGHRPVRKQSIVLIHNGDHRISERERHLRDRQEDDTK